MNLIIITGPPASGKLTIAKCLSEKTGYKLLHNHATIDLMLGIIGMNDPDFWANVRKLRKDLVGIALKNDVDLIFTFCYHPGNRDYITDIKNMVERAHSHVHFVQLLPSKEVLYERVEGPARKEHGKLIEKKELEKILDQYDYFSPINEKDKLQIDNTDLTPEQVAAKIIARFVKN